MKLVYIFALAIFCNFPLFSQTKFYNVEFPYFDTKRLVKPARKTTNTNRITKKISQIIEYNEFGQQHGATIIFRNDGSPGNLSYHHNGKLVYNALPFQNSTKIQKVFNYDDNGSFDGVQNYIYLNQDKNEWQQEIFQFSNGRLTNFHKKLNFPEYTINFNNGKLNGEFYFYDSLNCSCYYYGKATNGEISKILQVEIREDLTFEISTLVFGTEKLNSGYINDYENEKGSEFVIVQRPIIVENKNVEIDKNRSKIIFNKQIDWMRELKEISTNTSIENREIQEIDLTDTMYGAPTPYTLPHKQH